MAELTGYLRLEARHKKEKTIASEIYSEGASKMNPPIYLDDSGQPCLYMVSLGGGYADGDRYKAEIRLTDQAQLLLTTLSSTKIFRTVQKPVTQNTEIFLGKGSVLEYLPDPIIAYQDAQYEQKTVIRMEQGATLIYADMMTPGWSPDGKLFRYRSLKLKTEIYQEDELVVFDHIQLCPQVQNVQGMGLFDGYTHYGTMVVIGEKATPEFLDDVYDCIDQLDLKVHIGLSMLSIPGFTLRVLAFSTQDIEKIFERCHSIIRKEWFERKPISLRKY